MIENTSPKALSKYELMLLIPANINIEELANLVASENTEIEFNKLLSLINLIATKTVTYNTDKNRYYTSKKRNIHSNDLKKCCGNNYRIYYDFLFKLNILSKRSPFNNEIRGEHFGYGFTKSHSYQRLKLIEISNLKPVNFEKKFDNAYVKNFEKILYKLFDRTKFSIDFNLAEELLFCKYLGKVKFPLDSDIKIDWRKYSAYHGALKQLVKFFNGQHKFNREPRQFEKKPSGRFYSPLTILNKTTRSLLFYEGKKLQQLDVKNMFPYLLSQYLQKTAVLDSHRIERLKNCPAFEAKYKLNTTSYTTKDYLPNQWLEQYLVERYGTLLLAKPVLQVTSGRLIQQVSSKYFFLDKPKSLFQDSGSHFQNSNKKIYCPFLNNSQKWNWNHNGWKSKRERETPGSIYPNSYNQTKELHINSHLVTHYTETFNGLNSVNQLSPEIKSPSYYISTRILENLMNKEIYKFNELTTKGIIYDYFIDLFKEKSTLIEWATDYQRLFNEAYNYLPEQDRALTKSLFISMLYAQNNHYIKEQKVFKSEFPILYDLIREKKKGDHRIITNELFYWEAEIIIDTVARGLIKKQIPTFTIHDCIAVQEENIEVSELQMKDAFISRFGSCPQIELE